MDPIIIRYLIYGLVSAAIVSAAVCAPQLNQARDEIAFVKGYTHALEVHGLDAHSDDRTVWDGFKGQHGMFHADAWEQGYRRAPKTHGLAWSERDSREIWHNPYNATDRNAAIQNAASTTAMAMQNAADTLRR